MAITSEKLVKYVIKNVAKKYELDYEEMKGSLKKIIKMARNNDQSMLGMMEEIMDLSNIGSEEELEEFSIEVLQIYCRIKELDDSGSERQLRSRVWKNMESEFELDDEEEDEEDSESDEEIVELPPPEKKKREKKSEKN